jgi:hypothetical protein
LLLLLGLLLVHTSRQLLLLLLLLSHEAVYLALANSLAIALRAEPFLNQLICEQHKHMHTRSTQGQPLVGRHTVLMCNETTACLLP